MKQIRFRPFWTALIPISTGAILALSGAPRKAVDSSFLPHWYCFLGNRQLIWTHVIADALIGLSYVAISATLVWIVYRSRRNIPFSWMLLAFGTFIVACGGTHFMEIVTLWKPVYWLSAMVKVTTAIASIATAVALPPLGPKLLGMIELARAERQTNREQLRLSEEKYRSMFENAVEGMFQTTPEGGYMAANPALARMLGFESPQELVNTRTDVAGQEYVHHEMRAEFKRQLEKTGAVKDFEYEVYRKDGSTIWVSENARAVRDAEGQLLWYEGTVQNITERRQLQGQLLQMQKIDAIGRLAGGVAHDFNNVLMAISSYAELLRMNHAANEQARHYIDEILKASQRAAALTRQLLAFSRKQVIRPTVLDLNATVAEQLGMLKRLVGEDIEFIFQADSSLGRVKADIGQVQQVIMNLVINARDAMPKGGKLLVETSNAELDVNYVRLHPWATPGRYSVVSVSDTGCGMDAETKDHIFEPFFTTKEQGKGTGLGLATVYGILKQSGGCISVYSEVGHGTTFKVYLPRAEDELAEESGAADESSSRGDETILLVEDEEPVRTSAAEYLRQQGYGVLSAASPTEALEIASRHPQPIHLLLTDVVMPEINGPELSRQICHLHPRAKTLFISGYSGNLLSTRGVLDPGVELIQKPFPLTELGRRIRLLLDGRGEKRMSATASGSH